MPIKVRFTWEKDAMGYHAFATMWQQKVLIFGANNRDSFFEYFQELDVQVERQESE